MLYICTDGDDNLNVCLQTWTYCGGTVSIASRSQCARYRRQSGTVVAAVSTILYYILCCTINYSKL